MARLMFQSLFKEVQLFLIALQFLSRLPVKLSAEPTVEQMAASERYFPLVGLVLGLHLFVIDILLRPYFPVMAINVILIAAMMLFSGGLHLDGFADCMDAFYSSRNKEKMLEIMKDSHLGVMGGIGMILLFALLITFMQIIPHEVRSKTLLIMPIVSRAMMVNLAFYGIYPREEGLGAIYIENARGRDWFIALATTAIFCVYLFKMKGVILFLLSYAVSLSILRYSVRRIEGVTGDVLGMTNEVITLAVLLIVKFLYLKKM